MVPVRMHTAGLGQAPLLILRRNRKPRARTKDLVGLICHADFVEPLRDIQLLLKTCCSRRLAPEELGSRAFPGSRALGPSYPCPT